MELMTTSAVTAATDMAETSTPDDTAITTTSSADISNVNESFPFRGLISNDAALVMENVLQLGVTPVLLVCGVTMNVINMSVFARQGLSDRINLCLFSLAFSDCGYIFFFGLTRIHTLMGLFDQTASNFWKFRSMRLIGIYVGFLNMCNIMTLIISLERCACVLWPLKAKSYISTRRMAILILVLSIIIMTCCATYSTKYDLATFIDPVTNATRYGVKLSSFYLKYPDFVNNMSKAFPTSVPTIAVTAVTISTVVIALRMRAVAEWRQQSSHVSTKSADQRGQAALTRMLIMVCVLYTVCTVPYLVRLWITMFVKEMNLGGVYHNVSYLTGLIGHSIASTNSSVNFVIYFNMSTRFRNTLKQMLGLDDDTAKQNLTSMNTASETLN